LCHRAQRRGKTTMMDVITGKTRPDAGTAFFGQTFDLARLPRPRSPGSDRPQVPEPTVFENHTVFENLELAMKTDKRVKQTLLAALTRRSGPDRAHAEDDSPGRQRAAARRGAFARTEAVARDRHAARAGTELILLDEPVAGMTMRDRPHGELILELEGSHSIMVVEHDMDFVNRIARKVTVLHEGSVLAEDQ